MTHPFHRPALIALGLGLAASGAQALSTWAYDGTVPYCSQNASNANTYGNSYTCAASNAADPSATMTAFSTTSTSATQSPTSTAASTTGTFFDRANVADYGSSNGFGIRNKQEGLTSGTGPHAADTQHNTDVMLLSFGASVILSKFQIGWSGYSYGNGWDADVSLLRYDGTSPPPTLQGKTAAGLIADGWKLVNNYGNLTTGQTVNTGATQGSSWWLVSGFNSVFGGNTSGLNMGNDAFKLLSFAGDKTPTQNKTPEPASLALALTAVLAVLSLRRRRKVQSR